MTPIHCSTSGRNPDEVHAQSQLSHASGGTQRLTDSGWPIRRSVAAERNDTAAVELILDLGFPIETRRDDDGATALHAASDGGAADSVQPLLDRGADVEARDTNWDSSPIDWAIVGSGEHPASTRGSGTTPGASGCSSSPSARSTSARLRRTRCRRCRRGCGLPHLMWTGAQLGSVAHDDAAGELNAAGLGIRTALL